MNDGQAGLVSKIELHEVWLPLVRPFRTARGVTEHKVAIIVELHTTAGVSGFGECAAEIAPTYTEEFLDSAVLVLARHLAPALLGQLVEPFAVGSRLAAVRGHRMAKAALEMACFDAWLRARNESLADHLGASTTSVEVGVVVDLHDSPHATATAAAARAAEGYRRVKLKVEPGRDVDYVRATREALGRDVALWVDANGSFELDDSTLRRLDGEGLQLIEQPLDPHDFAGHARLARELMTPICLDESIATVHDIDRCLDLGGPHTFNLKPSRIGGIAATLALAERAHAGGGRVWIGGMLDTGLARTVNIVLSARVGDLPGDVSATSRYFARDITAAFELQPGGRLAVPTGYGIADLDRDFMSFVRRTLPVE